jgi:cobalt-zinc-cadmium efflux system membrane fusion protein
MVVYSPIDGVVTERRMNVGETATLMPPSVVLVVQDIERLQLRARLPETALRTLSEQSELLVTFPALEQSRRVRVKRIAPTVDARTRTIEIVAELDNRDRKLKAGMLAEVAYERQPSSAADASEAEAEASAPAVHKPGAGRP